MSLYVAVSPPIDALTAVAMLAFVMAVCERTWAGRSISTAKRAKVFAGSKTVEPCRTVTPILALGVASSLAFLGPKAHRSQPFVFFAIGIARTAVTARDVATTSGTILPKQKCAVRSSHTTVRAPKATLVIA
jgi:hypothetical protein